MASSEDDFVDFYAVLGVSPGCDPRMLESAYHRLAKRHHPDRTGSPDSTAFSQITEAYRVLRSPEARDEYDVLHAQHVGAGEADYRSTEEAEVEERAAISDAEAHARILRYLYQKRRDNAQEAGVIAFYVQEMLGCSDELFDFHRWYLKEKGFVATDEQGSMAITIAGVDHVISLSRGSAAEKLRIQQSIDGAGAAP